MKRRHAVILSLALLVLVEALVGDNRDEGVLAGAASRAATIHDRRLSGPSPGPAADPVAAMPDWDDPAVTDPDSAPEPFEEGGGFALSPAIEAPGENGSPGGALAVAGAPVAAPVASLIER